MYVADKALCEDVATANRIIERFGLSSAFGHVSARVPGTDTFVLPTRRSPGLAQADKLLLLNTEGKLLAGDGQPNSEFWIHARIYAARPDVGGVVHAHPPGCICLTQIGQPLRVVFNNSSAFRKGVPEYERIGLIRSRELGDLVAKRLGSGIAVMMRGHGMSAALPDVRAATVIACYMEETASMQLRMLSAAGGDAGRLRVYSDEDAGLIGGDNNASTLSRAWEYYAAASELLPLGHVKPGL
jgi:ribulose-5-phosphate 4-epimerase/fuculose-1-phosphate aldolase